MPKPVTPVTDIPVTPKNSFPGILEVTEDGIDILLRCRFCAIYSY